MYRPLFLVAAGAAVALPPRAWEHDSINLVEDSMTSATELPRNFELVVVRNVDDIRENLRRFNNSAADYPKRLESLVRHTRYWVYDPDSNRFGPGKFVGYRNMTWDRYEAAVNGHSTGVRFNGNVTHQGIASVLGEFHPNKPLTQRLFDWCSSAINPAQRNRIDLAKWRFATLTATRQYWACFCDPTRFAGLEAVAALDELVWGADRGSPRIGDRVLLWQGKGGGDRRGVISLGEIVAGPEIMVGPPEERPFWRIDFSARHEV